MRSRADRNVRQEEYLRTILARCARLDRCPECNAVAGNPCREDGRIRSNPHHDRPERRPHDQP